MAIKKIKEFLEAVKVGKIEQVRQLLLEDPTLVDARSESGNSAVVLATYYGQPRVAALLVARAAKIDIFEAAMTGSLERVREMLDSQPELANAVAHDGFQPLGLASFFGHLPVVELLLRNGAEVNSPAINEQRVMPLHSAAAGQHLEIVRLLLAHGADPNARQSGGFTPLHAAAQNGQIELARTLLEHGADPHARSEEGRSALDLAMERENDRVVEYLISLEDGQVE